MKANKRIILLLAAVLAIALLVTGMTFVASAEDGDLTTEYGVIPASKLANGECFAIFHKGVSASEWTLLNTYADPFTASACGTYKNLDGEVVILMFKNADLSAKSGCYDNATEAKPNVTIDLGNNTLVSGNSSGYGLFRLFPTAITENTVRNLTFKNGTVVINTKQLAILGFGGSAPSHTFTYNVTFDGVTFDRPDGAFKDQPLVQMNNNTQYGNNFIVNITYNDCIFDMRGISTTSKTILFNGNRGDTTYTVNTLVNGGEIYIDTTTNFTLTNNSNITFGIGENGYTSFRVPTGVVVNYTINGGVNKIEKLSSDAIYDYYGVKVGELTKYGEIPTTYESVEDYPFAVFTKASGASAYTLLGCYADPFVDGVFTSYRNLDGEVVILMRRGVDFSAKAAPFSNMLHTRPAVTVDLNDKVLISTESTNNGLFMLQVKTNTYGTNDRSFTFKNGTITIGSKPFMLVTPHSDVGSDLKSIITFDNVTFNRTAGGAKDTPLIQVNNSSTYAHSVEVNYNDCTFDMRGASSAQKMLLFSVGANASSKISVVTTVRGGEILADSANVNKLQFVHKGAPDSAVYFDKGTDGEYTTLTVPTGNFSDQGVEKANGVPLNFVATGTSDGKTSYKLCPTYLRNYTPKMSVTLSSDLIYNIYLPTNRLVSYSINGVENTNLAALDKVTIGGTTYFHIKINAGILAAAESIKLDVKVTVGRSGGVEDAVASRTVGILSYAETLLASCTEVQATLVKDMLAYVKAAYNYVGNTSADAAINAIIGESYANAPVVDDAVRSLDGVENAALYLNEYPAFIFYPDEGYNAEDFKFAIGNTAVSTTVTTIDGKTAILVETYAYAMTNTVTYTVEGTDVSGEFNLAAYLAAMEAPEANSSDELITLIKALYTYSQSAKAYKAAATA